MCEEKPLEVKPLGLHDGWEGATNLSEFLVYGAPMLKSWIGVGGGYWTIIDSPQFLVRTSAFLVRGGLGPVRWEEGGLGPVTEGLVHHTSLISKCRAPISVWAGRLKKSKSGSPRCQIEFVTKWELVTLTRQKLEPWLLLFVQSIMLYWCTIYGVL
jgi:hypothetical protein